MLKPTRSIARLSRLECTYPPRERWVADVEAYTDRCAALPVYLTLVAERETNCLPHFWLPSSRLKHHGPTSHEVGMNKCEGTRPDM